MKFHQFTPLQLRIIECIIALHKDEPPPPELEEYICAFDESFDPSRAFTLHAPAANQIILYFNNRANVKAIEANTYIRWMEKQEFAQLCRQTGKTLAEIADFWRELAEQGYVSGEYRDGTRPLIPEEQKKNWRRYQDFNPLEIDALRYGVTFRPVPQPKLYRFWESLREARTVGA